MYAPPLATRAAATSAGNEASDTPGSRRLSLIAVASLLLALFLALGARTAASDPQVNCVDFRIGSAIAVYAQRVSADGVVDPAWVPNPYRVCVGVGHEYTFTKAPDGQYPVIVAWAELGRDGSDIRAQSIDAGGAVTTGWSGAAPSISGALHDQHGPRATSDGAGGAIVVWEDFRTGRPRVYAQRISSSGTIASGWPQEGLALGNVVDQVAPAVVSDSAGGALVAWQEFSAGLFQIRVQRLTAAGAVASGWPSTGMTPSPSTRHQLTPILTTDTASGALLVWEESVVGEHKLIAARVDGTGALAPGWPASGLAMAASAGAQRLAAIVPDGAGGAVVAWYDTRSGAGDIYAQRFTGSGSVAVGWPGAGLAVCAQASEQYAPAILSDGANGAFIAWEDFRAGTTDVFAQRVSGAGSISGGWPADGVALTTATGEQYAPRLMEDGSGGAIATWFDTRSISGPPVSVPGGRPEGPVFALYGARPSPAVGPLRVAFALPDDGPARIELMDVAGRRVLSREVGNLGPGRHVVVLQGRGPLRAGIYVVRLRHAGQSLTTTVSVLR